MKNICIICPVDLNSHGGIEELIRQEIEQFESQNYEVFVISIGDFQESNGAQQLVFRNVINALFFVLFRMNYYDIVHFHDPRGILFLTLKPFLKSRKVILTLHGSIFHSKSTILRKLYFNKVIARNIRNSDLVIEPGFKMFNLATKLNSKSLLALPITKKRFTITRNDDTVIRIHSHARFSELKNQIKIVDLIISLRKKMNTEIHLIITGSSKDIIYTKKLKKKCQKYSWIKIIENCTVEELMDIRKQAPYFISLSKYEGFGITQVEAVQWDQYPLLYKYEGCDELFGRHATYLDESDDDKAVDQIKEVITSKGGLIISELVKCNQKLNKLSENNWRNSISSL